MQSLTQQNSSYFVSSMKNILEDSSLTFAEKAISIKSLTVKSKQNQVSKPSMAGDIAIVDVDLAMAQDSTGPLAIRSLNEMRLNKLFNPSRVLLVIDHTFPAADEKVANLHAMMRSFASKHSCMLVEGSISHQHILEYLAVPGMMILGADSHTCQAGCISAFATGIGSTEIAAVWATGQIWLRVPETIKIKLSGNFSKGVFARDLILDYIGKVGEDGANYKALEWTYANDNTRIIKDVPEIDIQPGSSANYVEKIEIECDKVEPMVAGPDHPDLVHSVEEIGGMEIDQAFIGSSTNGRIEDLEIAARILKGRKVHKNTRCVVTPASVKVYEEAIKRGYVETYLEAGAVFTNATCGACVGTHLGALGDNEICISSSSRNFVGRMGALSSKVYLASPATVAASAIEGRIANPRRYFQSS